jgi:hypothetical protein
MLRKVALLSLAASALSVTCWSGPVTPAMADTLAPANVEFLYRTGDRVTNDAYGSLYEDGKLGVSCDFHSGTGDLTFHTSSPGPGQNTRTLNFSFGAPLTPCGTTPGGKVPAPAQSASLTVSGIYGTASLPVGGTLFTRAVFFLNEGMLRYGNTNYCANLVMVTHPDASTWWISSTPTAPNTGDLAVIIEPIHGKDSPVFYWEMPFQIKVTLQ